MRDAMGGEVLREQIVRLFGEEPRIVSGAEEARLSFMGSLSGLSEVGDGSGDEVGMFDIGGGSTEVVIGRRVPGAAPVVSFAKSCDIGSVRLTERFSRADPPQPAELAAIRATARASFRDVPPLPGAGAPVGVAGTMTTLAAVQLGLTPYEGARVHGLKLSTVALAMAVNHLAKLDTPTRASLPGMEPKRADVIVAGGLIAVELLEHWRAKEVIISDRGVRWGLVEEFCSSG
jgi:exopolyphosphatase/guanosine-5'-triphosphate,3'-diphosphate pyrophosphatase